MLPNQTANATETHFGKVNTTEHTSVRGKYKDQNTPQAQLRFHVRDLLDLLAYFATALWPPRHEDPLGPWLEHRQIMAHLSKHPDMAAVCAAQTS